MRLTSGTETQEHQTILGGPAKPPLMRRLRILMANHTSCFTMLCRGEVRVTLLVPITRRRPLERFASSPLHFVQELKICFSMAFWDKSLMLFWPHTGSVDGCRYICRGPCAVGTPCSVLPRTTSHLCTNIFSFQNSLGKLHLTHAPGQIPPLSLLILIEKGSER